MVITFGKLQWSTCDDSKINEDIPLDFLHSSNRLDLWMRLSQFRIKMIHIHLLYHRYIGIFHIRLPINPTEWLISESNLVNLLLHNFVYSNTNTKHFDFVSNENYNSTNVPNEDLNTESSYSLKSDCLIRSICVRSFLQQELPWDTTWLIRYLLEFRIRSIMSVSTSISGNYFQEDVHRISENRIDLLGLYFHQRFRNNWLWKVWFSREILSIRLSMNLNDDSIFDQHHSSSLDLLCEEDTFDDWLEMFISAMLSYWYSFALNLSSLE